MRFGFCAGVDDIPTIEALGYDFETQVVGALRPEETDPGATSALRQVLSQSRIKPEVFNVFLPGDLKLTGEALDKARQAAYVQTAFTRVKAAGGEVIVFGSGRSRQLPEGFSVSKAKEQIVSFLELCAPIAQETGIIVALEPLNSEECNFINSVPEAVELVIAANSPAVKVVSDLHHVTMDGQPYSETRDAGSLLTHIHVASREGRRAPAREDKEFLSQFFAVLKQMDYSGRICVEGGWTDLSRDAGEALEVMRAAWDRA